MDCPKCGNLMIEEDVDSRQEWVRISYHCSECNEVRIRLITYQTQSSMVASDEWEGFEKPKKIKKLLRR